MYSCVLFTCICPLVGGVICILYPCTSAPLGHGIELSCTISTYAIGMLSIQWAKLDRHNIPTSQFINDWAFKHKRQRNMYREVRAISQCHVDQNINRADETMENYIFFEIKGRSTATSYKKKKHSYITRRSEHHHHTNNAPNKTLHHHKLGEEAKEAAANCTVVANAVPRQEPQPAANPSSYSNSFTMGLSLSSHTNTIVELSAPVVRQQITPIAVPMNTTDLSTVK